MEKSGRSAARRPGDVVLWRSVPDDAVSYCFSANLVEADRGHIALFQPSGAPIRRRTGTRTGPHGALRKGGWDGGYSGHDWTGPPSVRVHPVGRPYSVIRSYDRATEHFDGWYINLELPWLPSSAGYDSRDLVLDIVVDERESAWCWKDEDELRWSVAEAILTPGQAEWIRAAGRTAIADLGSRTPVFVHRNWDRWKPSDTWWAPCFTDEWALGARSQPIPERTPEAASAF